MATSEASISQNWTVLVYAVGNIDLEPYLYHELKRIRDSTNDADLNVVVQLSSFNLAGNNGPARYVIKNQQIIELEVLEAVDMTEPEALLDFLRWGAFKFPARRIMLIMSGHSLGFLGIMAAGSQDKISLMGIPGFAGALSMFHELTGRTIDILLMDTCFMDAVEIWFEIALSSQNALDYAILPVRNPSLRCLPYSLIIDSLNTCHHDAVMLDQVCSTIVSSVNRSTSDMNHLFALRIDKGPYWELHSLSSQLAGLLLHYPDFKEVVKRGIEPLNSNFISLSYLLAQLESYIPEIGPCRREIQKVLAMIVLDSEVLGLRSDENLGLKIYLPGSPSIYFRYRSIYEQLLFCSNNSWPILLRELNNMMK